MTNFERRPFDENPFWDFIKGHGSEDIMVDFEDK